MTPIPLTPAAPQRPEPPRADTAHDDPPLAETPRAETPRAETPRAEAPRPEAPRAETRRREPAHAETSRDQAPLSGSSRGEPTGDAESAASLGLQIDQAIGEHDARLAKLRETLQERRSEVRELEVEIADLEKEQAKAFKDLLASNPQIRRLFQPKPKRKPASRHKKATTTQEPDGPAAQDADSGEGSSAVER
jgi:hypothetical protein